MAIYSLAASVLFLLIVVKKYNLTQWERVYGTIQKPSNEISLNNE